MAQVASSSTPPSMGNRAQYSTDSLPSHPPWFSVPHKNLVALEHPYIIKNLDKGIRSLGGIPQLSTLVHRDDGFQPQAKLYQRPGNRLTKPIYSHNEQTHNVVLKITMPKRVGLKRKRGTIDPASSKPHEDRSQSMTKDTRRLVRSINDNPTNYHIEAIGIVDQTHRFRNLPDFVKSSVHSPFMQKMQETILPFEYAKLKEFKLDMSKGVTANTEIIPPPKWSQFEIPFNYAYRQNPGVLTTVDHDGHLATQNTQYRPKTHVQSITFDSPTVPHAPSPEIPPISSMEPILQRLVAAAIEVMDKRPIVTRRSLPNLIPGDEWQNAGQNVIKMLFQYVGYTFGSGPWRDTIVKFGIDPRTDPVYRIYQTMMFALDTEESRRKPKGTGKRTRREKTELERRKENHIFDGAHMSGDGKVWQVCDITDSVLKKVLDTDNLRQDCHVKSDGWYHNGTWVKAKVIMKWKIGAILTNTESLTDEQYTRVAATLPDNPSRIGRSWAYDEPHDNVTGKERELAGNIRSLFWKDKAEEIPDSPHHHDSDEQGSPDNVSDGEVAVGDIGEDDALGRGDELEGLEGGEDVGAELSYTNLGVGTIQGENIEMPDDDDPIIDV